MGIHYIDDTELNKITSAIRQKNKIRDDEDLYGSELAEQIKKNFLAICLLDSGNTANERGGVDISALDLKGLSGTIRSNSFYSINGINSIQFPKEVNAFGTRCFAGSKISKIECLSKTLLNMGTTSFFNNSILETLILWSESVPVLSAGTMFDDTKIGTGEGYIYVPRDMIEKYQVATNWINYADRFRAIEDYPDICGEVIS